MKYLEEEKGHNIMKECIKLKGVVSNFTIFSFVNEDSKMENRFQMSFD